MVTTNQSTPKRKWPPLKHSLTHRQQPLGVENYTLLHGKQWPQWCLQQSATPTTLHPSSRLMNSITPMSLSAHDRLRYSSTLTTYPLSSTTLHSHVNVFENWLPISLTFTTYLNHCCLLHTYNGWVATISLFSTCYGAKCDYQWAIWPLS